MKRNKILIFLFPFLFLILGIVASFLFNGISFSTVSHVESKSTIIKNPLRIFVKGDKVEGKFTAIEPHLGIIELRFDKYSGVNYTGDDRLMFRVKEDGSNNWYYQNVYPLDEFEKSFTLTFGFPIIDDSLGKQYDFEIESLDGNGINSVQISQREPVVQSVYQFPKNEILSPHFLTHFLYIKTVFSLNNLDFIFSSVLYFIPFLFYLLWLLVRNRINVVKRFLAYLSVLFIFLDCFLIPGNHTGIILFFIGVWIFVVIIYKLESSVTYLFALLFYVIVMFLILFKISLGQEKLQVYIYGFFVLGIVQSLYEFRFKKIKLIDYQHFLKDILNFNEK